MPDSTFSISGASTATLRITQPEPIIRFNLAETDEVMRLDHQGMVYKGVRIEDAGEAYRAFMEVMMVMKASR